MLGFGKAKRSRVSSMSSILKAVSLILIMKLAFSTAESDKNTIGASASKISNDATWKVESAVGGTNLVLEQSMYAKELNTYRDGYLDGYNIESGNISVAMFKTDISTSNESSKRGGAEKKKYLSYKYKPSCGKGKRLFIQKAAQCHTIVPGGRHKQGPNLFGICGRRAGESPHFSYTDAMKDSGITWNEDTSDQYLQNPKEMIPGVKMVFAGIKKKRYRQNLIHYLCHCIH